MTFSQGTLCSKYGAGLIKGFTSTWGWRFGPCPKGIYVLLQVTDVHQHAVNVHLTVYGLSKVNKYI